MNLSSIARVQYVPPAHVILFDLIPIIILVFGEEELISIYVAIVT
jgi:hypothetical protein